MTLTIEQIKEHLLKGKCVSVNPVWRYGLGNNLEWGWRGCDYLGCCDKSFNTLEELLESILERCDGDLSEVGLE